MSSNGTRAQPQTAGAIDPKTGKPGQVVPIDRASIAKENAPSTEASTTWVNWADAETALGNPWQSAMIPLARLYEMRRDPMIAFALWFLKVPLIRAPWFIKCPDAQVAAFVDNALRRIYGRFVLQWGNCLDFGYSPLIKRFELDFPDWTWIDPLNTAGQPQPVWQAGNVAAVVWKPFTAVPPQNANPLWTNDGQFEGFEWQRQAFSRAAAAGGGGPTSGKSGGGGQQHKKGEYGKVDVDHALWCTNEKDSVFGSLYGFPLIGYAFRYWWSYWFRWALADRAFEKHVDPATIVWFPEDRVIDDSTGDAVDTRARALEIARRLRSGASAAIPGTYAESSDGKLGDREWAVDQLKPETNFDALASSFEYLDSAKLRSMTVPEQAVIEGSGGTSSRNVAEEMADLFYESQSVRMAEIADHINRFLIPQLVFANFPDKIKQGKGTLECRFVSRGFSSTDMQLARQLVQLIGQADPSSLGVNVREVLEQFGVPLMHPEDLQRQQNQGLLNTLPAPVDPNAVPPEAMTPEGQANAVQPPGSGTSPQQIRPSQGAQATGVAAEELAQLIAQQRPQDIRGQIRDGMYIRQRERIELSATERFPRRLRDIKHLDNDEAMNIAADMRDIWQVAFEDAYRIVADTVAGSNRADFSEDDDVIELADNVVEKALRRARGIINRAAERTQPLRRRLMELAANVGLREQKVFAERPFDVGNAEVADWMIRQGAQMVTSIDDTMREELRAFIGGGLASGDSVDAIAEGIRTHFREFPGWKANRLARTEAAQAYNHAVLFAARQAGIARVMAHDASRGTNTHTDHECIERNGELMTIDDALSATENTHPNCTLGWDLIPERTNVAA